MVGLALTIPLNPSQHLEITITDNQIEDPRHVSDYASLIEIIGTIYQQSVSSNRKVEVEIYRENLNRCLEEYADCEPEWNASIWTKPNSILEVPIPELSDNNNYGAKIYLYSFDETERTQEDFETLRFGDE